MQSQSARLGSVSARRGAARTAGPHEIHGHRGRRNDPLYGIRTILKQWREAFLAYFDTGRASNGGTEGVNGPIEGTGISAKFIERGGADLVIIYNSGRFRMAGHSSMCGLLPLGDANAIVMEMGLREVLPLVRDVPVLAGVNGTDPTRDLSVFLDRVVEAGFSGVNNFPTVGLFDGRIRQELEASGLGFEREVEMIRLAHAKGLFTAVYVFTPDEAKAMVSAGADAVRIRASSRTRGRSPRSSGTS